MPSSPGTESTESTESTERYWEFMYCKMAKKQNNCIYFYCQSIQYVCIHTHILYCTYMYCVYIYIYMSIHTHIYVCIQYIYVHMCVCKKKTTKTKHNKERNSFYEVAQRLQHWSCSLFLSLTTTFTQWRLKGAHKSGEGKEDLIILPSGVMRLWCDCRDIMVQWFGMERPLGHQNRYIAEISLSSVFVTPWLDNFIRLYTWVNEWMSENRPPPPAACWSITGLLIGPNLNWLPIK